MTTYYYPLTAAFLLLLALTAGGTPHYVDVNSINATPPFLDWSTAATNIQDAVDAALVGDEIVVTNGIYATGGRAVYGLMTNRVAVDKPLTLRSVNGPAFTTIQGYQVPGTTNGDGAIRCVYLTNGASLFGFTLLQGATRSTGDWREQSGGGVWCESTDSLVSNCVLAGNSAATWGGGAGQGTLSNCIVTGNSAGWYGGGAGYGVLINCTLSNNWAGSGGGACYSTLNNCTLSGNRAVAWGGGAVGGGAMGSTLSNCSVWGNFADYGGGVGYGYTLDNCILVGNYATNQGGAVAFQCLLNNCTLTGNKAGDGGGAYSSTLNNSVVYFNAAARGTNYWGSTLSYCSTIPDPGGVGNITNTPLFVDYAGGNLRLQSNSPCVNAGLNAYAHGPTDLDGSPRIVRGTVDIGAYEYQGNGSLISYAWLQQYGWPMDGSVDLADPDGDGMNNLREWRADTIPTNALSVLRMITITNGTPGLRVTWQSVPTRNYWLDHASSLTSLPSFSIVASNIAGQLSTTTYADTNAIGPGPFFYRVGVQP
jgi:parallel beta-helix repeat protein